MRRDCFALLTFCVATFASGAEAGIPRGAMLAADEQIADEVTGTTIARGNAEITIAERAINGSADSIEVHPNLNEIIFKGRALLVVGGARYQSDTVTCTLDFMRCGPLAAKPSSSQAAPRSSTAAVTAPQ